MSDPTLYYVHGSPFARAARILVQEWALQVTCQELPFPPPDDLFAVSPFGQVPALNTSNGAIFPTIPVLNWMAETASCPQDIYDPLRDLQLMLSICQMGDALVAAYYQAWAGLRPLGANKLGFDPAERHFIRSRSVISWLDNQLKPAISPPWITFACLMLWAEDRGGFSWRDHSQWAEIIDDYAARDSFQKTGLKPW